MCVVKICDSFHRGSAYNKTEAQRQLDESNKGHQTLRKMGWGGAGLGAKEQGIEQPISGGEVGILAC
jgi:calcium homeostasis ER protein